MNCQLKLLQGSAKGYRLDEDPYFTAWFQSLMVLDDNAAYEISLTIQPERTPVKGHRKNDSFASNSSSENIESALQLHRKVSKQFIPKLKCFPSPGPALTSTCRDLHG